MPIQPMILQSEISDIVVSLAEQISFDYKDKPYTMIAILNGSFFFVTDLLKTGLLNCELEFIRASSYKKHVTPESDITLGPIFTDLIDRNILLVDDIVDRGITMSSVKNVLMSYHQVKEVKTCSLLYKSNKGAQRPDYIGFSIKNKFVFGYGLDLFGKYRHFSSIYVTPMRGVD